MFTGRSTSIKFELYCGFQIQDFAQDIKDTKKQFGGEAISIGDPRTHQYFQITQ